MQGTLPAEFGGTGTSWSLPGKTPTACDCCNCCCNCGPAMTDLQQLDVSSASCLKSHMISRLFFPSLT